MAYHLTSRFVLIDNNGVRRTAVDVKIVVKMIMDVVDMLPIGFHKHALAATVTSAKPGRHELVCAFSLSFDSIRPPPATASAHAPAAPMGATPSEGKDDVPLNTPAATSSEAATFFASETVIPDPVPITGEL